MLEKGKIDSNQAVMLMVSLVLPTAILLVPAIIVKHARQDAWLAAIVALLGGLLIARLVVSLSLRFPEKTLFEYAQTILGKVPGKLVGFLYIWWFLYTGALIMDEFASFLCTAIMPETPPVVLFLVGIAVAAYAVRNGLEVLSRYNQLLLPILLGLLVFTFLLVTKDMKAERLLPVFDQSAPAILKGAAVSLSWLGEIVLFAMIIPFLQKPREAHRVAALATLFTGLFFTISTVVTLSVFGPNLAAHWVFPVYNTVRLVSIANFLERLDIIIVAVWVFGGFAKMGVFYYAAVLGSAQWLGLKDYRPLVAPVGLLLVGLALLCDNIVDLLDFAARAWPPYALIVFEVGLPLFLMIVALVRGKGESNA